MSARGAVPTDVRAVAELFGNARAVPERSVIASVLPVPYLSALCDSLTLLRGALGIHRRARLFVESHGALRSAALVYVERPKQHVLGRRPVGKT